MSRTHEERMLLYRDEIEKTITEWLKPELNRLDKSIEDVYGPATSGDLLAASLLENAKATKKELKTRIQVMTNQNVLGFTHMLERLEENGILFVQDDVLENALRGHLLRLGIRLGLVEGAMYDQPLPPEPPNPVLKST